MSPRFSLDELLATLSEVADAKLGPQWIEKVMALRQMVLALQEDNLRLLDAKRAAHERVLELQRANVEDDHWRELEHKYPLRQVAAGVVARVGKRTEDPKEPTHQLCADCFSRRKEGFLQRVKTTRDEQGNLRHVLRCGGCGAEFAVY